MNAWMIRAGRGGTFATDWVENSIIGIGWDFDGLDIASMDRDQIRATYAAAHPAESKQKVATSVGQVFRFAHSMKQGSTVVMYDPAERLYHIGVIAGPCSPVPEPEGITYTRAVTWNETGPRTKSRTKSGPGGSPMYTKEEREGILWEFRQSGLSVPEACRRLPLFPTRANLYRWLRMEEAGDVAILNWTVG